MGWLKTRMEELEPPARSFSVLARKLHKASPWLRRQQVTEDSLATYLGQLDRGKLDWFKERPQVQKALAEVLEWPIEDVEERLQQPGRSRAGSEGLLRLWDVDVRPLELRREPLPPGLPRQAHEPRSWPCWWVAPSGSGRTWVGKWLEARGIAFFVQARTWPEAEASMPARGPVFVELTAPQAAPLPPTPPTSFPLCIAADVLPPKPPEPEPGPMEDQEPAPAAWACVGGHRVEEWIEPLIQWVAERLSPEDDFDPQACLRWLREGLLARGQIDVFGTALGCIGLFAKYPRQAAKAQELDSLARLLLKLRLSQLASTGDVLGISELLKGLRTLARNLLRGEERADAARPLEGWYELARVSSAQVEHDWIEAVRPQDEMEAKTLRTYAERLPPSAYKLVRSLQNLRVLRDETSPGLALRPLWLLDAFLEKAADALLDEGPHVWGSRLTRDDSTSFVVQRLIEHFRAEEFASLDRLLASPDPKSPAWVGALEASFLALGRVALEGGSIPVDTARALLEWQRRLMLEVQGLPRRRLEYGTSPFEPLLRPGSWMLAAFALNERVGEDVAPVHRVLNPWMEFGASEASMKALDKVWQALVAHDDPEQWRRALGLFGRLFRRRLTSAEGAKPAVLFEAPEYLLSLFRRRQLGWDSAMKHYSRIFPYLRSYVEGHGESWRPFAEALWRAWLASSSKDVPPVFMPGNPWTADIWSAIPPEAVADPRVATLLELRKFPYEHFGPAHWLSFLKCWEQRPQPWGVFHEGQAQGWRHMPVEIIRQALASGVLAVNEAHARAIVWERFPKETLEEIRIHATGGRWSVALQLVKMAPKEHRQDCLSLVGETFPRQGEEMLRAELTALLHEHLAGRPPGWERAWELLDRIAPPREETPASR